MMLKKWEELPEKMRTEAVRPYYDILEKKKNSLFFKRVFDILVSTVLLALLAPVFLVLAIAIKADSKGPVFYRQERVTQYGKHFRIFKFRTMVNNADKIGSQVTVGNDSRITRVGKWIRDCRLDEICQLIDVLRGTMTLVGTRPEVPKYVNVYTDEMKATLLLPAGVTSLASIMYKNEAKLIENAKDVDKVYIGEILPKKMEYNLKMMKSYSFLNEIRIMFLTVISLLGWKANNEKKDVSKI